MSRLAPVLAALLLPLVLAGCGSDDDSRDTNATEERTGEFSPSPEVPEKAEDPHAPNLGDSALTVGETRDGSGMDTTLLEVRNPYPSAPELYREPAAGNVFVGLNVKACLDADVEGGSALGTYNGEWAALTRQGTQFAGTGTSWNDWPAPKFPEHVGMVPGRCVKGWMNLEVPEGTRIESILWSPMGTPIAEWLPK